MLLNVQYAYADRNDAIYAYMQGDYESAYNIMISLANTSDDKLAQYYIGMMFMRGQGVLQDYEAAAEWFRKASKQGVAAAMYKLAGLYNEGKGVPHDMEFAYIWYHVAATHEHRKSINTLEDARAKLSDDELAASAEIINEYVDKYGPSK